MGDDKKVTLLYLAPFFRAWASSDAQNAAPGSPGVCLVFDSMESMRNVYPDVDEDNVMVFPLETKLLIPTQCRHCGGKNTVRCIHCRKVY